MRVYFKKTNGNDILFITDGIVVKAFYTTFEGLDLYTENVVEQVRRILDQLVKDDMLLSFDEIQGEDEWNEPFIDNLIVDCELIIDTEVRKHENSEH